MSEAGAGRSKWLITGAALTGGVLVTILVFGGLAAASSQSSSIQAGFNGTSIPAGSIVWFSSVIQPTGVSTNDNLHLHFVNQTLTFSAPNGTSWVVKIPNGVIVFDPSTSTASTSYATTDRTWFTIVPASYSQDIFISGFAYKVPSGGLPGGMHVTWSGVYLAEKKCISDFNWKFAAAVYSSMGGATARNGGYNGLGVKPVDSPGSITIYNNSDHAGTPENYTADHTQGAMGGGGSNYTGSYSSTVGFGGC